LCTSDLFLRLCFGEGSLMAFSGLEAEVVYCPLRVYMFAFI
jgi:hypothetical protein